MDLLDAVGDAREILANIGVILVRALWRCWRMFGRVALGRAGLDTGGVTAVSCSTRGNSNRKAGWRSKF
jgi:hypothetical protein